MSNANAEEVKLSLKVMINEENNKVLFAQVDSDVADVLLSFLTLPLGKIVRLMKNHYGNEAPVIGSLNSLYSCLGRQDKSNFWTEGGKQMLLDPPTSFSDECSKLKINVDNTMPATKYFRCGNVECSRKMGAPLISMYHDSLKCDCGEYMNKPMGITGPRIQDDGGGVFMKKGLSFLITDDLQMVPVVPDSIIQTLINLGVTITAGAQQRILSFGLSEIMDLLRASLLSSTPLTDVVFHQKSHKVVGVGGDLSTKVESSSDSKKLIVKGWARPIDTDKTLFFLESREDFLDFLLSLLIIPLSGVEWLLGANTGLRNIDNLYRSIQDGIDDDCFTTLDMKSRLMKPKLPPGCLSKNQMFPLEEEPNPKVCYFERVAAIGRNSSEEIGYWMHFKDPKGGESFVKSTEPFHLVEHISDSTVTALYGDSECARKLLTKCPQPKESELHIGLGEALNILRSSLTSTSVGLANLIGEKLNHKNCLTCSYLIKPKPLPFGHVPTATVESIDLTQLPEDFPEVDTYLSSPLQLARDLATAHRTQALATDLIANIHNRTVHCLTQLQQRGGATSGEISAMSGNSLMSFDVPKALSELKASEELIRRIEKAQKLKLSKDKGKAKMEELAKAKTPKKGLNGQRALEICENRLGLSSVPITSKKSFTPSGSMKRKAPGPTITIDSPEKPPKKKAVKRFQTKTGLRDEKTDSSESFADTSDDDEVAPEKNDCDSEASLED